MPTLSLTRCLGAIETMHPTAIPDGYALSAINVDLSATEFLRPRAGTSTVSLTSGPAAEITYLFADNTNGRLWAFVSATGTGYYWNGSSWSSVSLGADFTSADTPHCVAYGGKVFMAFNGSVNRLHVYDSLSTSPAVRRVGIETPSAATVGNTGAGAYAATLRYYKVQMLIHRDPSDASTPVHASSELSDSVSFTPSGGGTAARITKPTTVDSATHWRIYGSTDNITFYQITGDLAVATTTYDDNVSPSNYYAVNGVTAPEAGLFIPPPSAKFLATNGERIFMAGSYETTATSTQTAVNNRRVWFTRPLGATDSGDDESITQTSDSRYWVDLDNDDGSSVTGLASTLDGSIYAFTATSVWRLSDTGNTDKPIRAERIVAGSGAIAQYLITTSDTQNADSVYFMAKDGPYRYSPATGAEYLGSDWVDATDTAGAATQSPSYWVASHFDPFYRRVMFGAASGASRVFTPSLAGIVGGVMRGGWALHQFEYGNPNTGGVSQASIKSMATFGGRVYFGGQQHNGSANSPVLFYFDATESQDDGRAFNTASITTGDLAPDPLRNIGTQDAYLWKHKAVAASVDLQSHYGPNLLATASDTAPAISIDGGTGNLHRVRLEGTAIADTAAIRVTVSATTPIAQQTDRTDAIARLDIPFKSQEAA